LGFISVVEVGQHRKKRDFQKKSISRREGDARKYDKTQSDVEGGAFPLSVFRLLTKEDLIGPLGSSR
jgi:hypothetical protein